MGEITQPFKVFDSFPRTEILPSDHETLDDSIIVSGYLLTVEHVDDFLDLFDILQV